MRSGTLETRGSGAIRINLMKASWAATLALAVVVVRPLVWHATNLWTSNAVIGGGTDVAEHGVLPAKMVLRIILKLRRLDRVESPRASVITLPAAAVLPCLVRTRGMGVVGPLFAEMRSPAHCPRGPPGAWATLSAAGLFEYGRALGSLKRA